jgi:hypothetical protein
VGDGGSSDEDDSMSDAPQGPDWWQASDDKWYPPPRPQMPGDAPAAVAPGYAPPGSVPGAPPLGPPAGTPSGGYPQGGFPPAGPPGGPGGPGAPGPYGPSPYGGVPGQQPSANRTPLFIGLGVVVAIAVIGLIVALSGGDDDDGETSDRPQVTVPEVTAIDPGETTETTDAGSVGDASEGTTEVQGLELVDSGWSVAEDDSIVEGSYGIIIENKGEELVTNFNVEVAIYDLNDTVVGTNSHMVAKLAPGETLGIGYDINDDVSNGISRLDVAFEEGYGDSVPEGAFTVSEVATTTDEYGTETTFTVASSYTVDLDSPYAYVIYRDAAGKIIGGTYGLVDMVPAGGRANGTLTSYEPVPGVETAEVWVDQGFF